MGIYISKIMQNINNQHVYANSEFILLSIINNKIGIVPDIHIEIIKYIKYVHIIKKTILTNNNNWNTEYDIQQNFVSYFVRIDNIKTIFFGNDKDIFDNLATKHKCVTAPIYKISSHCYEKLVEAAIYVPDLFPIHEPDPILNYPENRRMYAEYSNYRCDNFVIKNPIGRELEKCINNKITLQIYKCNHPILNLLLSNGYVQSGVIECKNYYFTGFLHYGFSETDPKRHDEKKITLITPKEKNTKYKPICEIVKEFIIMMQNIKDNFGITATPFYEILCNDDVENFIDEHYKHRNERFRYNRNIANDFGIAMDIKKNNCYRKYIKAYNKKPRSVWKWIIDDFSGNADEQISHYINIKCSSKQQRERYNLDFYIFELSI